MQTDRGGEAGQDRGQRFCTECGRSGVTREGCPDCTDQPAPKKDSEGDEDPADKGLAKYDRRANRESREEVQAELDKLRAERGLTKEAVEKLRRGIAALIATTYCLKRPKYKHEPWDGPCGRCAPCLAKAAYDAAFGEEVR